jgi:hypothetical protein
LSFFQHRGDFFSFVIVLVAAYSLSRRYAISAASEGSFDNRLEAKLMNTNRKLLRKKIIAGSLSAVIAAGFIGSAAAQTTAQRYELNAFSDIAYGSKVVAGQYAEAIDRIYSSRINFVDNFYAATNLCVAHIMTRDLKEAAVTCDAAVTVLEAKLASRSYRKNSHQGMAYRKYLATALSNRGVLHVLEGAAEKAQGDFRLAMELESQLQAPESNMARLAADSSPSA